MPQAKSKKKENYTKTTFFSVGGVFITLIIAAFLAYLFRLLMARNLSLEDFGFFFALVAFAGLLNIFRDIGLSQALVYFVPRFLAKKEVDKVKYIVKRILQLEFFNSVIILIIMVVLSDFFAEKYFHYSNPIVIILFSIAYLMNSMELNFQVLFNAFQNHKMYGIHNLARAFLVLITTLIFFSFSKSIFMPIYAQIIAYAIIVLVFGKIFFQHTTSLFQKVKEKRFPLKKLIMFGLAGTFSTVGFFILASSDTILLTYFTNLESVGLYNGVTPLVSLLLYIPYALIIVLGPLIAELWSKKKISTLRLSWEKSIKFTVIIMVPVIGVFVTYPSLVLSLLYGEKFTSASSTLVIMAIGALFFGIGQITTSYIMAIEGPKKTVIIYATAAIANIILGIILIPKLGIVGAAISTSLSYIIIFASSAFMVSKYIGKINLGKLVMSLIAGALFVGVIKYIKEFISMPVVVEAIVVILIALCVYAALLFVFKIINIKEFAEIKDKILKK